jgi:dihydropyrimidinase
MVSKGRFGPNKFVEWTATAPARIYGLSSRKGSIGIGADADIAIWDPDKEVTFADRDVVDGAGYTPYAGRTVRGWPTIVLRRGEVITEHGGCSAAAGSGEFLARTAGDAAEPLGRLSPEFDPSRNFGARLY